MLCRYLHTIEWAASFVLLCVVVCVLLIDRFVLFFSNSSFFTQAQLENVKKQTAKDRT